MAALPPFVLRFQGEILLSRKNNGGFSEATTGINEKTRNEAGLSTISLGSAAIPPS
jgi:hypothetical protein